MVNCVQICTGKTEHTSGDGAGIPRTIAKFAGWEGRSMERMPPRTPRGSPTLRSNHLVMLMLLLTVLVVPSAALAQLDVSGYYEHSLQVDAVEDREATLLHGSKLRLDLAAGLEQGELAFRGNLNAIRLHPPVEVDLSPYLPKAVVDQLSLLGIDPRVPVDPSRIELDNAWLTWSPTSLLRIRAGRQQLSWGPGYATNPTDLFHSKTLLDPTYEKPGVGALRADLRWGMANQVTAVWAPGESFGASGYALRTATHLSAVGYDVAITAHAIEDTTSLDLPRFRSLAQRRYALGGDFAGSLLGVGVWFEGNMNWMEEEDDFIRALAGIDYTLPEGWYVQVEGFYNGRGEVAPFSAASLLESLLFGEPPGRGWVMAGTRKEFGLLTSAMLYAFAAPDGSVMVNPRVRISIAQNADLLVFGGLGLGDPDGVFPANRVTGFMRAYVYF